ncbi:hypothetical protein BKA61DRAFT_680953 [Leptodontidium sp. MPI-SDFR-AT-0119]|nr:hypothetical protein BKA61DRAFT_680953 [Leptodontidium sp. MPI-SDFR-AT-0119]
MRRRPPLARTRPRASVGVAAAEAETETPGGASGWEAATPRSPTLAPIPLQRSRMPAPKHPRRRTILAFTAAPVLGELRSAGSA